MTRVKVELAERLREAGVSRVTPVLAAVSGGADSIALLHALVALGQRTGAAHIDHALRAGSRGDAAFVAEQARRLGIPFHGARLAELPSSGSPEGRWREARYRALESIRVEHGYAWLLTAHTLDDQAETVLLRAAAGTGPAGLVGIVSRSEERQLLRPLLRIRRVDLRASLGGREFRADPSNDDLAFPRNRIRAAVLPELERALPGASRNLAALAALAGREHGGREQEARALAAAAIAADGTGFALDGESIAACPDALRARVWRHLFARVLPDARVTRVHIERLDAFLADPSRRALSLPGDRTLRRRHGGLWIGPEAPSAASAAAVRAPGRT